MLTRLADFLHAHGRRVLIIAVIGAALCGVFGAGVATHLSPYGADDPATQSVQATKRWQAAVGRQLDAGVVALITSHRGPVTTPAMRQRIEQVSRQLSAEPTVAKVVSILTTPSPAMVSRDRTRTYVVAYFKPLSDARLKDVAQQLERRFAGQADVTLGGGAIANAQANTLVSHDLARAELFAFPLIFLLSLLFFRSLVASLLPPLLGGLAIITTFLALRIVAQVVDISVFALNLVTGLGLGLAIFPQRFLYSMGIAGALVALLAALLALLVLPALLAVLGPRVNALAPKRLQRAADRDARPAQSGAWYRLSRFVMRRPGPIAAISAAVLIALGIPFLGIKFVTVDASALPHSASARQVDDALTRSFPPNRTAPLQVVVGAPARSERVRALRVELRHLPDVSAVSPAQPGSPTTSLISVAPAQPPLSGASQRLLRDIRALHPPFYLGVAGQTAAYVDLEHSVKTHLPAVLGVIVAATLIVLFLFTGSVVLPVKAVIMNALSLSAVFGLLVLIFQDGRLEGLLGYQSQGALDATRTGRIVTAAALLFAVAIGAFATSELVFIKELGIGTALAVLIDASIVRALLVPSLMELLGRWNWWAPAPLRRLHDRVGLSETGPAQAPRAPAPDPA